MKTKFAKLVKVNRVLNEWTQQHLADRCGYTRSMIYHIEREHQEVSLEQALKFSEVFEIDLIEKLKRGA